MIATGLNVLESLLSISMISTPLNQACGCGLVGNNLSSGDGVSGSSPSWETFHQLFNFSINGHSKYQNTVFFIFKLINKKKYSIILKLEIILYFT